MWGRNEDLDQVYRDLTETEWIRLLTRPYVEYVHAVLDLLETGLSCEEKQQRIELLSGEYAFAALPGTGFPFDNDLGSYHRYYGAYMIIQRKLNALKNAIDVYAIIARTGTIPNALPPNMTKDPYTDQDFIYERIPEGFLFRAQPTKYYKKRQREFVFKVDLDLINKKVALGNATQKKPAVPDNLAAKATRQPTTGMGDILFKSFQMMKADIPRGIRKKGLETLTSCKANLRTLGLALTRYQNKHHGDMPTTLLDLHPDYFTDPNILTCPEYPYGWTAGDKDMSKLYTSYSYEFSLERVEERTYREWKTKQLKELGARVPVVRCFHHPRPLNLTWGGEILIASAIWEDFFPVGHTLKAPDARTRYHLRQIAVAIDDQKSTDPDGPSDSAELNLEGLVHPSLTPYRVPLPPEADWQWTPEQRKEFGGYLPVVSIKGRGVLNKNNIINLAYNGEIWEARCHWATDSQPKTRGQKN
jgi:hypothetical protein